MTTPLLYHWDPPDITEPWQTQPQYPMIRVDGDTEEAIKYDLLRLFIPCGNYISKIDNCPIGIYRWMRDILSITLYVAKDKKTVYCKDRHLFSDIRRLYLSGAKQVYFIWNLCTLAEEKVIFHISASHAEAVHRAWQDSKDPTKEVPIFMPPKRGRTAVAQTQEGAPNPAWVQRTMPSIEFPDQDTNPSRNMAPRAHHRKSHAVPHPGWPLETVL